MQADDETNVSEIEILPDGRIYVFGLSRELVAALGSWTAEGDLLRGRLPTDESRQLDSATQGRADE